MAHGKVFRCIHGVEGACRDCRTFLRGFVESVKRVTYRPMSRHLSARQMEQRAWMSRDRRGIKPDMTPLPEYPDFEQYRENFLSLVGEGDR